MQDQQFQIVRFKYCQGTISYSNPQKTCSWRPAHHNDKTKSVFANSITIINSTSISFSALRTLLHQLIYSLRVNNKGPLTPLPPSGHLKCGPGGHHIDFLCASSEALAPLLRVLAACPRFWGFPQLFYIVTWTVRDHHHPWNPPPSCFPHLPLPNTVLNLAEGP